jgi:hypothetical protein
MPGGRFKGRRLNDGLEQGDARSGLHIDARVTRSERKTAERSDRTVRANRATVEFGAQLFDFWG